MCNNLKMERKVMYKNGEWIGGKEIVKDGDCLRLQEVPDIGKILKEILEEMKEMKNALEKIAYRSL